MAYRVDITPEAETDLDECYRYIARDSQPNALAWWQRLYDAIDRLSLIPEACSLAPENDAVSFEVRQKLFGNYRILLTIEGDRVIVLRIRHTARLEFLPDEIPPPRSH